MDDKTSGFTVEIAGKTIRANRPEPILDNLDVVAYDRDMNPKTAIDAMVEGYAVLVVDYYSSGMAVLKALKAYLKRKHPGNSFQNQRDFRDAFRALSQQLLLRIQHHKLLVKKAPDIGWLQTLYPGLDQFLLPFTQVQGLNSAWQWYTKGLSVPGLNIKIHPYYGTYFPTRFEHLELFNSWLKRYQGAKKSAIDVGTGCGVISFQLLQHGFEQVTATDTSPNALIGLHQSRLKNKQLQRLDLLYGDLFAGSTSLTELIVFNPPWLPAPHDPTGLDEAVYYRRDLFPRFFKAALEHLSPGGKVVLLFSNLAQITRVSREHPIKDELAHGGRFEKELLLKKGMRPASKKTKRNQNWRSAEVVELWVLKRRESLPEVSGSGLIAS